MSTKFDREIEAFNHALKCGINHPCVDALTAGFANIADAAVRIGVAPEAVLAVLHVCFKAVARSYFVEPEVALEALEGFNV